MKKPKFTNKYENYSEKEGTIQKGASKTITEFAEDTDIYKCIEKYGITALMRKYEATDFYYDDFNNQPKTLLEKVQQRDNLNKYFKNLPANVRKQFGDSSEEFYQKYKNGDFETMLNTGILNEELAKRYKETIEENIGGKENEQMEKDIPNTESISTGTN